MSVRSVWHEIYKLFWTWISLSLQDFPTIYDYLLIIKMYKNIIVDEL